MAGGIRMTTNADAVASMVETVIDHAKVTDMHTHLFAPELGSLLLCGADELLTFHYLIAESFRVHRLPYEAFWRLSKSEQSELIWKSLFEQNFPLSEAASGVVAVARRMGCDTQSLTLEPFREALSSVPTEAYIQRVLDVAGVSEVVMTNDPFDPSERALWTEALSRDPRFHASLRLDRLMNDFESLCPFLQSEGYDVEVSLSGQTMAELRRFLWTWIDKTVPVYIVFSVADDFAYPDDGPRGRILEQVLLPLCKERKLALSIMVGAHLMNFGCWWFVNTDSLVDEITRMRLELLGPTFIPQHSDARVLEQLIYKWDRARVVLKRVLADKYRVLLREDWEVTQSDIERDVDKLLNQNFWDFVRW